MNWAQDRKEWKKRENAYIKDRSQKGRNDDDDDKTHQRIFFGVYNNPLS